MDNENNTPNPLNNQPSGDSTPNPVQPTETPEPVQPIEPTKPLEPAQPTEPTNPSEPIPSAQPIEPSQPAEPIQPTTKPKSSGALIAVIIIVAVVLLGLGYFAYQSMQTANIPTPNNQSSNQSSTDTPSNNDATIFLNAQELKTMYEEDMNNTYYEQYIGKKINISNIMAYENNDGTWLLKPGLISFFSVTCDNISSLSLQDKVSYSITGTLNSSTTASNYTLNNCQATPNNQNSSNNSNSTQSNNSSTDSSSSSNSNTDNSSSNDSELIFDANILSDQDEDYYKQLLGKKITITNLKKSENSDSFYATEDVLVVPCDNIASMNVTDGKLYTVTGILKDDFATGRFAYNLKDCQATEVSE